MAYKALTASRGSWQTVRIWRQNQCGVTGTVAICQHVSSWVWFITGEENHPGTVPAVPAAFCAPLSTVCHDSCARCSGPAASHCVACIHPHVLLQGHCLPSCGEGFYPNHGVCEGTVGITVIPPAQSQERRLTPHSQILPSSTTFPLVYLKRLRTHQSLCHFSLLFLGPTAQNSTAWWSKI